MREIRENSPLGMMPICIFQFSYLFAEYVALKLSDDESIREWRVDEVTGANYPQALHEENIIIKNINNLLPPIQESVRFSWSELKNGKTITILTDGKKRKK
jgi:hypothetical protein